jgi:hypothetical protein
MKCSKCGKENSYYVSFCESCGSILGGTVLRPESEAPSAAVVADVPRSQAKEGSMPQESDAKKHLDLLNKRLSGIRFAADRVQLIEKKQITLSLGRDKIESIELRRGFAAQRPIVQAVFGLILLAACFFPLRAIFMWWFLGGSISLIVVLLMLVFLVPLGTWQVADGLRMGYFLQVIHGGKRRKVPFARRTKRSDIDDFLATVSEQLGYQIRSVSFQKTEMDDHIVENEPPT